MLTTLAPEGYKRSATTLRGSAKSTREIEQFGAKVLAQWATLGKFDFVNVIEAPDDRTMAHLARARLPRDGQVRDELEAGLAAHDRIMATVIGAIVDAEGNIERRTAQRHPTITW